MINDCKLPVLLKIEQGSLSWISNTTRHTKLTEIKRIKMIEEKGICNVVSAIASHIQTSL